MFIAPKILALDFDGVVCDGMIEYFQTTKKAYAEIWNESVSDELANSFYKLRPVIETGWEMPVLLRALVLEIEQDKILTDWHLVAQEIVKNEQLEPKELAHQLDTVRDKWIESDLDGWLGLHRFYPGVVTKVREVINADTKLYIVTTKEGRFVKQLLHNEGIELPQEMIFGKEYKQPKHQILRELMIVNGVSAENVWFVEDRLKTLELVQQQPDLPKIGLFLADWGYNTQQTRESISYHQEIKLLSLEQFKGDFAGWVSK